MSESAPYQRDLSAVANAQVPPANSPLEILLIFLRLGCTCFGGPIAHLGYFRAEFVERRKWLTERAYVDLVALSQFLPGPASSQTGFGIGLMRGGLLGGLAAWTGFTVPSAVLLVLFAYGAGSIADSHAGAGLLHGLKLVAVAIVAQAVMGMARSLCPDRVRASIATVALIVVLVAPWSVFQIGTIVAGGIAGWLVCGDDGDAAHDGVVMPLSRRFGIPASSSFSCCWSLRSCPCLPVRWRLPVRWPCSMRSIVPAPSCLAAAMSCCRCCATPSSGPAGFPMARSWPDMARRRPCPAHSSPSRPISARWRHVARRCRGRGDRAARDLCAGHSLPDGDLAILARSPSQAAGASRDARHQCGCRRPAGSGALQSGLDKRGRGYRRISRSRRQALSCWSSGARRRCLSWGSQRWVGSG